VCLPSLLLGDDCRAYGPGGTSQAFHNSATFPGIYRKSCGLGGVILNPALTNLRSHPWAEAAACGSAGAPPRTVAPSTSFANCRNGFWLIHSIRGDRQCLETVDFPISTLQRCSRATASPCQDALFLDAMPASYLRGFPPITDRNQGGAAPYPLRPGRQIGPPPRALFTAIDNTLLGGCRGPARIQRNRAAATAASSSSHRHRPPACSVLKLMGLWLPSPRCAQLPAWNQRSTISPVVRRHSSHGGHQSTSLDAQGVAGAFWRAFPA